MPRNIGHRTAALVTSIGTLLAVTVPAHALSANAPLPRTPVQIPQTQVTAPGTKITVGPRAASVDVDPQKAVSGIIGTPPPASPPPTSPASPTTPSTQSGGGGGSAPAATAPRQPARTAPRAPQVARPGSTPVPPPAATGSPAGIETSAAGGRAASGPGGAAPTGTGGGASQRIQAASPVRRGPVRQIIEKVPAELLAALIACALFAAAMSLVWLRERGRVRVAQRVAHVDALTGIPNRLAFEYRFSDEWKRARRYERPLGILLLDLDGLKRVNDRDGHEAGDRMIKTAATRISEDTRQSDLAARLAGDEFVVLCPETSSAGLEQLGGKLTEHLQQSGIAASVGWAALTDRDVAPGDLLARADAAMYQDKARRRAAPPVSTARPGLAIAG